MKYTTVYHYNSKKAVKHGLHIKRGPFGQLEIVTVRSAQVFRDMERGTDLPRETSKQELRGLRSIYSPHVGKKQLARMA